jgi:hypothetical protein
LECGGAAAAFTHNIPVPNSEMAPKVFVIPKRSEGSVFYDGMASSIAKKTLKTRKGAVTTSAVLIHPA